MEQNGHGLLESLWQWYSEQLYLTKEEVIKVEYMPHNKQALEDHYRGIAKKNILEPLSKARKGKITFDELSQVTTISKSSIIKGMSGEADSRLSVILNIADRLGYELVLKKKD